jgi:hypothetical protein
MNRAQVAAIECGVCGSLPQRHIEQPFLFTRCHQSTHDENQT